MTAVATRGTLRLVDDGGGQGHIEGQDERRPLDSFLKWGYWKPVDAVTAAFDPSQPRYPRGTPMGGQWRDLSPGDRVVMAQTGQVGVVERVNVPEKGLSQGLAYVRVKWDESGESSRVANPGMNLAEGGGKLIKASGVHYGTPTVDVEPFEWDDGRGKRWLVDAWAGEGEFDTTATGILIKKDGTLGDVRSRSLRPPMPPEVRAEMDRLQGGLTAAAGPIPREEPLIRKYEQILERNAKRCKANYLRASRVTTAAGEPANRNPLLGEVLNEDALEESTKATEALRKKIAVEAAQQAALEFGISFAVVSPFVDDLVKAQAGRQAERIVEGVRDLVASIILRSLEEGWSVLQTAKAIHAGLSEAKRWQATMLARTDLIAMANGGSFAAASALGEQRPLYKRWINADDEKVRPTHVDAENQVVLIDQPFHVGDSSLMFPGDPSGPDGEVINCRCTLVYTDDPEVMVSAGWDESEHPRHPEGSRAGGKFAPKGAPTGSLTGDEAATSWLAALAGPREFPYEQREAVYAYQGAWYSAVNHMLRDPADFSARVQRYERGEGINSFGQIYDPVELGEVRRKVEPAGIPQESQALVSQLDKLMRPSPADMTVYRYNYGPSMAGAEAAEITQDVYGSLDKLKPGDEITDLGFQSTTLDGTWAKRRLEGDRDGVLHTIHVPKGTPSMYLNAVNGEGSFTEEEEMLLARGLKLRVQAVERDGERYAIDWEVLA